MKLGLLAVIAGLILIGLATYPLYVFVSGFFSHPLYINETETNCNTSIGLLFNIKYNNDVEISNSNISLTLTYNNNSERNLLIYSGNLLPNETISKCFPVNYFENATKYEFFFSGKIAGLYYFNFTEVNSIG
ncbi:MAG: hypothetical protein ACP5I6_02130 [Caldisphaera sp.]|nr:hypothetical protein [Caldisphaera sp.]PMP59446.1 MAG: hypothetical protein C0202_02220 [Caldisphaera sp.]PMP88951.1 MAG: hypothetical protein C0172_01370 [Caldisphaera sp.]